MLCYIHFSKNFSLSINFFNLFLSSFSLDFFCDNVLKTIISSEQPASKPSVLYGSICSRAFMSVGSTWSCFTNNTSHSVGRFSFFYSLGIICFVIGESYCTKHDSNDADQISNSVPDVLPNQYDELQN